jgi:hypothetical protein
MFLLTVADPKSKAANIAAENKKTFKKICLERKVRLPSYTYSIKSSSFFIFVFGLLLQVQTARTACFAYREHILLTNINIEYVLAKPYSILNIKKFMFVIQIKCVNLQEKGNAREVITRLVDDLQADLLVLGSRSQGGLRKYV